MVLDPTILEVVAFPQEMRAEVESLDEQWMPFFARLEGPLRMLYSGQLGRMHDVDTLARLLEGPVIPALEVVLQASGAGYAALQAQSRGSGWAVRWGSPQATLEWAASMQDLGILPPLRS